MSKYLEGTRDLFFEEFKKWVVRLVFLAISTTLVFLFTPLYENIKAVWEVPERLTAIENQIAELQNTTRSLTGEDRVIRQSEGMSYVEEPVYLGDNISIVIVAGKTAFGETCTIQDVQGLFTDEGRIATPGQLEKYARKPVFTRNPTAQKLELIPPPNLKLGRVEVYLIFEYDCNGKTYYDRTAPIVFELLRRP